MEGKRDPLVVREAFFDEFPFLNSIEIATWTGMAGLGCAYSCLNKGVHHHTYRLGSGEVHQVRVERIDRGLLDHIPSIDSISSVLPDRSEWSFEKEVICLFDKAGKCITTVMREIEDPSEVYTVGEAIIRCGKADSVACIVWAEHAVRTNAVDGTLGHRYNVTVYKKPKRFTLTEWVNQQYEQARADLRRKIKAIEEE